MSRSRTLAVAAAFAAWVAAVTAIVVAAPQSSALEVARPQVGKCRNMTVAAMDRASNNSPTVSCSAEHTTLTFAVPRLPSGVTYRGMSSATMFKWSIKLCTPLLWKKVSPVHTLRDRSLYGLAFFVPTAAERAAGARWVRCDLMLFYDQTLQPLPASTSASPVLSGSLPPEVKRCLKKLGQRMINVACDHTHDLVPYTAFFFKHRAYPTRNEFIAVGRRRCPGATYWSWVGETWWKMGDHAIVCYRKAA